MQLVGATEMFIMKPFLKTFMKQGFFAALIALIFITISLFALKDYLPDSDFFQNDTYVCIIYTSVVALSLLLTMLSTIFSMKKYLNAELDKFYA